MTEEHNTKAVTLPHPFNMIVWIEDEDTVEDEDEE